MLLPNGNLAVVTDEKLFNYLLNEAHEIQPGHADLFNILLGITVYNGELFRSALLDAAMTQPASVGKSSPYGTKYEIRFDMTGLRKTYTILSIWMIKTGQNHPVLVTAFIE